MATIIQRMAERLGYSKTPAPVTKESQAAGIDYASWEATQGMAPATTDDLLDAYSATEAVYRAVEVRANCMASVPLRFWRGKSEQDKVEITEGLPDLFWKPNPTMGYEEFMRLLSIHLDLCGMAYWEKAMPNPKAPISPRNPILELWPLMPTRMYMLRSKERGVFGFEQWSKYRTSSVTFRPEQIAMFKNIDPADIDGPGLAVLAAARRKVALELNATKYNNDFFVHGAEPGVMLMSKKRLDKGLIARILQIWKLAHEGKAHRVGILDDDMDIKQVGLSQKDMQFLETLEFSLEAIGRAFGIPPVCLGILRFVNYSVSVEQKKLLWNDTLIPELRRRAGGIDRAICSHWGDDVWCEYAIDKIGDLQENADTKATRDRADAIAGIVTINEVRADRGMDPVPWGDVPPPSWQGMLGLTPELKSGDPARLLTAIISTAIETALKQGNHVKAIGPGHTPFVVQKAYSDVEQKALWTVFSKRLDKQERAMKRAAAKFLQDQADRIDSRLTLEWPGKSVKVPERDWLENFESEWWQEENIRAWDALKDYIKRTVQRGVDSVGDDWDGDTGSFDWKDPRVVDFLREKKITLGADINKTTYESLRKVLAESVEANETIADMAKRIRTLYDDMEDYRSERIARTESGEAMNFGVLEGYRASGFAKKGWLGQFDEWIRDTHAEASRRYSAHPIPIDEPFEVGDSKMMFPGDSSLGADLKERMQCRCGQIPFAE